MSSHPLSVFLLLTHGAHICSVFSLPSSEGEIGCLSRIVEAGQIDILKHPVVETFLHMKWQMIRKMVYAYIALYTAFLVSFTTLVLIRYIKYWPHSPTHGK